MLAKYAKKVLSGNVQSVLLTLGIVAALVLAFRYVCSDGCLVLPGGYGAGIVADGKCHDFDGGKYCQFEHAPEATGLIPGGGYQDPGYGQGQGSIGAAYEGFDGGWASREGFTAQCLGQNPGVAVEYPSMEDAIRATQQACYPEPKWNLPRDFRRQRQPVYPCQGCDRAAGCHPRHPMDSIYAPPNEGAVL